jgi:hypothetical protein
MKRFFGLVALMLLTTSAEAGQIAFSVGGHRIRIEAPRHCRSTSCASVSVSGIYNSRRRVRDDDQLNAAPPPPPSPAPAPAPAQVSPPFTPPAPTKSIIAAAPPPPPAVTPPPALEKPPVVKTLHEEEADTPLGDWQTESKGVVRIAQCGAALCGYTFNSSSNDKGEAILINMKPKTDTRWTGSVYSKDSGDTYYGSVDMKGPNTLRVEACAFSRFYCSGNNWIRISTRPMMTSRQQESRPRS